MTGAKRGPWIAGTVIVSLLLVVGSWFLLISPVFAATGEAIVQTAATQDANTQLQQKVNKLKAEFAKLDEYRATLAAMQVQIPTVTGMAEFQRQLAANAALHSVTIVSLTVSPPAQIVPPAPPVPPADPTTDDASTDGSTAPADGSDPAAAAPAVPPGTVPGFYQVPVSIDVVGTYANVQAFLSDLQAATPRLFLVETMAGTSLTQSEAAGGKPAIATGDLGLVITGSAFVLTDPNVAPPAPVDPAAPPVPLPVPDPAKNPLVPLP